MNIKKNIACMALMISTGYSSLMSPKDFGENLDNAITGRYTFEGKGSQEPGLNESFEYYKVVGKFVGHWFEQNKELLSLAIAAGKFGINTEFMWTLYNMASMGALRVEVRDNLNESFYEAIESESSVDNGEIPPSSIFEKEEPVNDPVKKPTIKISEALEDIELSYIAENANKARILFLKDLENIKNIEIEDEKDYIGFPYKISEVFEEKIKNINLDKLSEIFDYIPVNDYSNQSIISKDELFGILKQELSRIAQTTKTEDEFEKLETFIRILEENGSNVEDLKNSIQQKKASLELTKLLPEKYKEDVNKINSANKIKDLILENSNKEFSEILKNLDLNDIELIYSESEYQTQFGLYGFNYSGKKLDENNLSEALIVRLKEIINDASYEQIEKIKTFEKFYYTLSEEIKQRKGYLDLVNTNNNSYDTSKFTEAEIKAFTGKILEELNESPNVNILKLLGFFGPKEIGFLISRMQPLIDTKKFYYLSEKTIIDKEGLFKLAVEENVTELINNAKDLTDLNDIKKNIPNNFISKDTIEKKENELKASLECPNEFKEVFEKVKEFSQNTPTKIVRKLTYKELKELQNDALRKLIEGIYNNHTQLSLKINERIKFIEKLPDEVDAKYKDTALQIADKFKESNVKFDEVFDDLKQNNNEIMLFATNDSYSNFFESIGYTYKGNFNKMVAEYLKNIIQNTDKDTLEYIEKNAIKDVKNAVNDSISIRKINFKTLKDIMNDLPINSKSPLLDKYIERIKELVPDAAEDEIKKLYNLFNDKIQNKMPDELTKMNDCIKATDSIVKRVKLSESQKSEMNKLLYNAKNADEFLWSLSKEQLGYIAEDYEKAQGSDNSSAIGYVFEEHKSRMSNLDRVFRDHSKSKIEKAKREELNDIKDRFLNNVFDKTNSLLEKWNKRNIVLTQEETNSKLIELNEEYKNTEYKDAANAISISLKDTVNYGMEDIVKSISKTDEQKYLLGTDFKYLEILKNCNRKTVFDNLDTDGTEQQNRSPEYLIQHTVSSYFKNLIKNSDNQPALNQIVIKLIDPLKTKLNDEIQKKKNEFELEDNFKLATDNPTNYFKDENVIEVAKTLAQKTKEVKKFDDLIKYCTTIPELLLLKKYDVYKKYYEAKNNANYQKWELIEFFVEQIKNLVPLASNEDFKLINEQNFGKAIYDSLKGYIDARAFISSEYPIMKRKTTPLENDTKVNIRAIIKDTLQQTNDTANMMQDLEDKKLLEQVFKIDSNNNLVNANLIKHLKEIDPKLADKLPKNKYAEIKKAIKNLK